MGQSDTPHPSGSYSSLSLSGNSSVKIAGENNAGVLTRNVNLQVFSSNCNLNLNDNSNGHIKAENSSLNLLHSSNISLSGKGNKIKFKDNANTQFQGDNNDVEAVANNNLKVCAKDSLLKLWSNMNMEVDTVKGNVIAERNVNLKISGVDGHVQARDTVNHELRSAKNNSAEESAIAMNKLEIHPTLWSSKTTLTFNGQVEMNSIKFTLDYVEEAVVEGNRYKLGVFEFIVETKTLGNYEIKFNSAEMDMDSLEVNRIDLDEVVLKGSKGGVTQQLKLRAPIIDQRDAPETTFDISAKGSDERTQAHKSSFKK